MGDHKLDLFNLQGKVAVVCGAGGGIGGAIAQALAGYGANIMIVDRDLASARSNADRITGMGARALAWWSFREKRSFKVLLLFLTSLLESFRPFLSPVL